MLCKFLSIRFVVASAFAASIFASPAWASVWLSPGAAPSALPGTTAAAESDLAGVVVEDRLTPFTIALPGGAPLFQGKLQARIVRSNATGLLHFVYRIRDTRQGLNGIVKSAWVQSFPSTLTPRLAADWSPDGLGVVAPQFAQRAGGVGAIVRFDFDTVGDVLVGGRDSRFFFLKTMAKNSKPGGKFVLQLVSGQSVVLDVKQPSP
jgi:hypothetical protein